MSDNPRPAGIPESYFLVECPICKHPHWLHPRFLDLVCVGPCLACRYPIALMNGAPASTTDVIPPGVFH